jgi:hypothetical protein
MTDPHQARMKEFFVGVTGDGFPSDVKQKVRIHLCDECFKGLYALAAAPTLDTVVHARWITLNPAADDYEKETGCSGCGNAARLDEEGKELLTTFCPECGAAMDAKEDV